MIRCNIRVLQKMCLSAFVAVVLGSAVKAQHSGPTSPDYMGFEPVDGTDMVNLISGDLTYSIPLLSVGDYPVVLSNYGGVAIDQDASWVGLGWRLNTGALNRFVSEIPDDTDEYGAFNISMRSGVTKYQTLSVSLSGMGGGLPYSVGASYTWGDVNSFYGTVAINGFTMDTEGSIGMGGSYYNMKFNTKNGVGLHGSANFDAALNTSTISAGDLVLDAGSPGGSTGLISGIATQGLASFATKENSNVNGSVNSTTTSGGFSIPIPSTVIPVTLNIDYRWTKTEWDYLKGYNFKSRGTLYPESFTSTSFNSNQSRSTDVIELDYDKAAFDDSFLDLNQPHIMLPAYDNFLASGQGINFDFKAKYKEIGRLFNYPRYPVHNNTNGEGYIAGTDYHTGSHLQFLENNSGADYWGIESSYAGSTIQSNTSYKDINGNTVNGTNRYLSNKFGRKGIVWFTNDEINTLSSSTLYQKGFIEASSKIASDRANQSLFPSEGIGAFTVTNEQGYSYHYSIPVYQREKITSRYEDDNNAETSAKTVSLQENSYAITWLLTAITGPDFVDANGNYSIDEDDYGYWVKFDHGKFSDSYLWESKGTDRVHWGEAHESYTREAGLKDIYYLNSIKSRTHTAYFIKGERLDAMGGKYTNTFQTPNVAACAGDEYYYKWTLGQSRNHKLLNLDKIVLFRNQDIPAGFKENSGSHSNEAYDTPSPADWVTFYTHPNANCSGSIQKINHSRELKMYLMDNLIDYKDYNAHQSAIESNALKIIDFDYNYSLAKESPYSASSEKGRLTLDKIYNYGRGNVSQSPPYEFTYYNDYDFDHGINLNLGLTHFEIAKENSDEWGYFSTSYDAFQANNWSLKSILTPLGAKLDVVYEEDSYYNEYAFGDELHFQVTEYKYSGTQNSYWLFFPSRIGDFFSSNDQITVDAYIYPRTGFVNDGSNLQGTMDEVFTATITSISADRRSMLVNISQSYYANRLQGYLNLWDDNLFEAHAFDVMDIKIAKNAYQANQSIKGGGLRVKEIGLDDMNGNRYVTSYDYTDESGKSTGVTSFAAKDYFAPEYIPYSPLLPGPKVMYEQVSVSQKSLTNLSESITRYSFDLPTGSIKTWDKDYEIPEFFEVETTEAVTTNGTASTDLNDYWLYEPTATANYYVAAKNRHSTIKNNLASIGRVKSVETLNSFDQVVSKRSQNYYNPEELGSGVAKESHVNMRRVTTTELVGNNNYWQYAADMETHVKHEEYSPLQKSEHVYEQGKNRTVKYADYSHINGMPKTVIHENSFGELSRLNTVFAHEVYPEMGPKWGNSNNKNLLNHEAARYVYLDNSDDNYTNDPLLSASASTWENDWDYREYNPSSSVFTTASTDQNGVTHKVWRKSEDYVWRGKLQEDGAFKGSAGGDFLTTDRFNFNVNGGASTNVSNWIKDSEITLYDHYSNVLENKNINGIQNSKHYGYNNTMIISVQDNSSYLESAYTGVEDYDASCNCFGGEVFLGSSASIGTGGHTGTKQVSVSGSNKVALQKRYDNSQSIDELQKDRNYIVSFWKKGLAPVNVNLQVKNTSGSTLYNQNLSVDESTQFGEWYLQICYLPTLSSLSTSNEGEIMVSLKSGTLPIIVDDFRVQPLNGYMTSYVYDDQGRCSEILDGNNIATRFKYDPQGRLEKVYKEFEGDTSAGGFKMISKAKYHFARD